MDIKKERWIIRGAKKPEVNLKFVEFMCYQLEEGERNKYLHYQGYVEFKKAYTGKYVKSLFKDKTLHIEPAEKCRAINLLYCHKDSTSKGERFLYNSSPPEPESD